MEAPSVLASNRTPKRPHLLASRRLLPLFIAQTAGALNDNLVKNALVVLVVFRMAQGGEGLVALAGASFILPYALFSALAGTLADRSDKARMIRITKGLEVALAAVAAAGFLLDSTPLLFLVLFGLGAQATFFGPLKYGVLPDHLPPEELVAGNGWIEAGTFAGILVGTIAGGALILLPGSVAVLGAAVPVGAAAVSGLALLVALAGFLGALRVPPAPPRAPGLPLRWNLVADTLRLVAHARSSRPVWLAAMGLSWFWTLGAIFLAEFPILAHDHFRADPQVVTLMLTGFALGVGLGSIGSAKLLRGEVSARFVPLASLGLSLFAGGFAWVCLRAGPEMGWHTVGAVLGDPWGWAMLALLLGTAACGGAYSVPLYAILQEQSEPAERSRMIAANNVLNAGGIVLGSAALAGMHAAGLSSPTVLAVGAALNLVAAAVATWLLPQAIMRGFFRWYFTALHGVRVEGLEHYLAAGPRAVVVPNHLSFLDGCLIAAFVPDHPSFAVNTSMTRRWWAAPFLAPVDVLPVDPTSPYSVRTMVRRVQEGRRLVIFPEGRITVTGGLMKVYEGAGLVADKAEADVIPVRLDGLQFTPFSRMRGKLRRRLFPPVTLRFLPARRLHVPEGLIGRARRRAVGDALADVMASAAFEGADLSAGLFRATVEAARRYGWNEPVAEDIERQPLTYRRLVLGAAVLGRALEWPTGGNAAPSGRVGLMLPNANGALVTFMALQAIGRVPAMLNHSAGADSILQACQAAELQVVVSSRRFVERAKLGRVVERLAEKVRFVWLEDLRAGIGWRQKLRGMLDARRPHALPGWRTPPEAPATVLFTSGSEGAPKGVVLSHLSVRANCAQLAAAIDFSPADRVLNALPMFHAFGLTGGTLLPLLHGVRTFFYPSPLHYRVVPEIAYDSDATIVFGTDTFLSGWARFAHPYDFRAVRYVFAGAERVREETKRLYGERFGVRVLEGYGATECAPVIAMNTAMHSRGGTVGRFLPGIAWRLDPVPGIAEGGRLHVSGPNLMLGYLRVEAPGVLQPPPAGWYDTGDIVSVDEEGFATIRGRAKRFAKVAGEMVSLAAAEALALRTWPDAGHAVVSLPDARKGERLVLVTTEPDAQPARLLAEARAAGVTELAVPRTVVHVASLPLLATGKVDYPAVQRLAAADGPSGPTIDAEPDAAEDAARETAGAA